MADDLIPISDEQAKAIQEVAKFGTKGLEITQGLGRFLHEILGAVPENLVGVLGGDRLAAIRAENLEKIAEKAEARRQGRRTIAAQRVSLTLAIPLIQAAADESRPELQDLWARLINAAMDPARARRVRQSFIEAVKNMAPIDALVFQKIAEHENWSPNARDAFADMFKVSPDEIEVSFGNLAKLDCVVTRAGGFADVGVTAFGRLLAGALRE